MLSVEVICIVHAALPKNDDLLKDVSRLILSCSIVKGVSPSLNPYFGRF